MLYCFLDTNIFIHCKDIQDIDWKAELGASAVCLVIAPVVFEELDEFKDNHKDDRKRNRARRAINFLESVLDSSDKVMREGVSLGYAEELQSIEFSIYNLNANNNDDRLVASAICWSHKHSDDEIVLVSHDSGPRMKAKRIGLAAKKLSDKCSLPDQRDPRDKEIRELKSQLARIENAQPKLQLGFRDSNGQLISFLRTSNDFSRSLISDAELDDLIALQCENLQSMRQDQPIANDRLSAFSVTAFTAKVITSSQIEEYKRELDEYPEHLRTYLLDKSLAHVFTHRSVQLNLVLMNEGSTPAQNIEISLDFRGSSEVLIQVPEIPPIEPRPPAKPEPRSLLDFHASDRSILPYLDHRLHGNNIDVGPPGEEWNRATDISGAARFEYGIAKLPHHKSCDIEEIYLMFYNECEFPETVAIKYEVTADNMVDMLTGELTVIVHQSSP